MSAKKQCTCDSGPDVAGAYHSDPTCPVHFPKKRPKVPRELVGLFWRMRWVSAAGPMSFVMYSRAESKRAYRTWGSLINGCKLYRVTVWRVRK